MNDLSDINYQNLIGKKLANVPSLNGMTTAVIERRIPWLLYNHEIASNTCLKDGTPYFREYCIPFYDSNEQVKVEEIDLGFYDPDIEARYLYRVFFTYYEHQYTSTYPFYQWEYNRAQFRQETLRYKTIGTVYQWERDLLDYQSENLPRQYINFDKPEIELGINMNSGIGIEIESDSSFYLLIGEERHDSINNRLSIPIVKSDYLKLKAPVNKQIHQRYSSYEDNLGYVRYRTIKSSDGDSTDYVFPTFIRVSIKGESIASRSYYPEGEIEELEKEIIHKARTSLDDRLIPPGIKRGNPNFPTEFWNYKYKEPEKISTQISSLSLQASVVEL